MIAMHAVSGVLPQNLQNRVLRVLLAVWLLPQNSKPLGFCGSAVESGWVRGYLGGLGRIVVNEVQDRLFSGSLPPVCHHLTQSGQVIDRTPKRVGLSSGLHPLCAQLVPDLVVLASQGIANKLHGLLSFLGGPPSLARVGPGGRV